MGSWSNGRTDAFGVYPLNDVAFARRRLGVQIPPSPYGFINVSNKAAGSI